MIGPSSPWRREDNVPSLIGNDRLAEDLLCQTGDQLFGECDQVLVVRIRDIELQHGELGIMDRRNAFVSEVPINLKHAGEPSDDQALEIEFRRDAQVEIHTEGIMVCDERLGRGASGNGMHHGGLDLKKPTFDQKRSDAGNDTAPGRKDLVDLRIGDQIDIALSIPGFDIRQAMPLLRKRAEGLAEKRQLMHLNREFIRLRTEQPPRHSDPITEIKLFHHGVGLFGKQVLLKVHLKAVSPILQDRKPGFPETP